MSKINRFIFLITLLFLGNFFQSASAQETDLCPDDFNESIVTTGYVDCYRQSGLSDTQQEAEFDRLEREAVCLAEPRSEVIFSEVVQEGDRYRAKLICRIDRIVPPNTILCPDESEEVFRAFDTLVCQYYGDASTTEQQATVTLNDDAAACSAAPPGGNIVDSSVRVAQAQNGESIFYYSDLSCSFSIPPVDLLECPVGFEENSRTDDLLECTRLDLGLTSLAAVQELNANVIAICSDTTAGFGTATFSEITATTIIPDTFSSEVVCQIDLPRYSDFVEGDVVRACDASCTEDIELVRTCLNGGMPGDPGCVAPPTDILTVSCNTGTKLDSLCPLLGVPTANIVPLLLMDEEEEDE